MKQIDHTSVFTVIVHIKNLATLNNTSDHIQVKSLLNVLSVEEALFLQECSKPTSEHTLD